MIDSATEVGPTDDGTRVEFIDGEVVVAVVGKVDGSEVGLFTG